MGWVLLKTDQNIFVFVCICICICLCLYLYLLKLHGVGFNTDQNIFVAGAFGDFYVEGSTFQCRCSFTLLDWPPGVTIENLDFLRESTLCTFTILELDRIFRSQTFVLLYDSCSVGSHCMLPFQTDIQKDKNDPSKFCYVLSKHFLVPDT